MQAQKVPPATPTPQPASGHLERIGRIVAVTGAHAIILLDAAETFQLGIVERGPEIGTLL
jgi:hypothetical protein